MDSGLGLANEFEAPLPLTHGDVRERVEDWLARINHLYHEVAVWARREGWSVLEVGSVAMHEHLMAEFGIERRDQPALRLDHEDARYALFKPKALWVIGANGRIDLYTSNGVSIIIDEAEAFEDPRWTVYRPDGWREGRVFEPSLIDQLA